MGTFELIDVTTQREQLVPFLLKWSEPFQLKGNSLTMFNIAQWNMDEVLWFTEVLSEISGYVEN